MPTNDTYGGAGQTVLARLVDATSNLGFGQTAGVTLVSDNAAVVAGGSSATWTLVYQTGASPANLGNGLYIQLFVQSDAAGGSRTALFDNVTLDVVPEPATAGVLAAGALLARCGFRRRRAR